MGCFGLKAKGKDRIISTRKEDHLVDAADRSAASVWPAPPESTATRSPSSPSPLPLPSAFPPSSPQPLPRPSSCSSFSGSASASFGAAPKLSRLPSIPQPLPPVPDQLAPNLRSFDSDCIARLCGQFSPHSQVRESVFRCSIPRAHAVQGEEDEAVGVFLLKGDKLKEKDWIAKVGRIAQLDHRNVCKVLGFAVCSSSSSRVVVVEGSKWGKSLSQELLRHLDWDGRLDIALEAAVGLEYLHQASPFQAADFGPQNVILENSRKRRKKLKLNDDGPAAAKFNVKLEVLAWEESSDVTRASNVRGYGILLLELLSGQGNLERLIVTGDKKKDDLFVRWARGVVNDNTKLSSIVDPRLLLHCPLSVARDVANFALSCLYTDHRLRPTMREAVSLLQSLHRLNHPAAPSCQEQQQHQHFLGRSATFSSTHQEEKQAHQPQNLQQMKRDLTPPPCRISTTGVGRDWQWQWQSQSVQQLHHGGARSAGASPARFPYHLYSRSNVQY